MDGAELGTSTESLPEGFILPDAFTECEILWDIGTNEGDEWDSARSCFFAFIKNEENIDAEAAENNAQLLYEALDTVKLPLGDDPDHFVAYSA